MAAAESIRAVLAQHPRIDLAILFGSLADGRERPDSDLDLAVQAATPLSVVEKMALIGDLAEALGRPVDLIDISRVGEPLLGQILKGKRLLGSDEGHARLITRHLIDAADFLPLRERILRERRVVWIGN